MLYLWAETCMHSHCVSFSVLIYPVMLWKGLYRENGCSKKVLASYLTGSPYNVNI